MYPHPYERQSPYQIQERTSGTHSYAGHVSRRSHHFQRRTQTRTTQQTHLNMGSNQKARPIMEKSTSFPEMETANIQFNCHLTCPVRAGNHTTNRLRRQENQCLPLQRALKIPAHQTFILVTHLKRGSITPGQPPSKTAS